MPIAVTRRTGRSLEKGQVTYIDRQPIDTSLAVKQHRQYEDLLSALGLTLVSLPAEEEMPDAPFVEDVAVVVDEVALITPMGSETRKAERESVRRVLEAFREVLIMSQESRLEGGDVLRIGGALYVGLSSRTDRKGVEELRTLLGPLGYQVQPVPVERCLHLKTGCTYIGQETILINPRWIDRSHFAGMRVIEVHPEEENAANALRVSGSVLMSASAPRTLERVHAAGFTVHPVQISELEKVEAGLTCLSLLFSYKD